MMGGGPQVSVSETLEKASQILAEQKAKLELEQTGLEQVGGVER